MQIAFLYSNEVPEDHIPAAINGMMVGLGDNCNQHVNHKKRKISSMSQRSALTRFNCLDMGYVRGIDMMNKIIYILSPLSEAEIARVNTIVIG